jgi:hypothetical protein
MNSVLRNAAVRLCISMLAATSLAGTTQAQLIGLKTVPVPSGEQFLIYPSRNLPMGGVSIALPDPLLDPFTNPALGARVRGVELHALPTVYTGSGSDIGGVSLPIHMVLGSERYFGGFGVVLQQLNNPNAGRYYPVPLATGAASDGTTSFIGNTSPANTYVHGFLGGTRNVGGNRMSLAGSVFWAGLSSVDGVARLYANNSELDQNGHMLDFRVGVLAELSGGRSLEGNFVHNDFNMTHNISYVEWKLVPLVSNPTIPNYVPTTRSETNLDHTTSNGLHIGYMHPLAADGWRIGALLNLDMMSHPKIPTYNLISVQNIPIERIPRDPGDSHAADIGVGLAYDKAGTLFGLDVVFEPASSHTWADTTTAITTRTGGTITPGQKTVDNTFQFANVAIATGMSRENDRAGFQLGLQLRSTRYTLHQINYVQVQNYNTRESWMEWTPSWGATLKLGNARLRYVGRLTVKGSPNFGFASGGYAVVPPALDAGGVNYLVPVTSAVTLPDYYVFTNQVSFSIPIGK